MKQHTFHTKNTAQRVVFYFLLTSQLLTSCSFREELKLPNLAANEQQEQGGFTSPSTPIEERVSYTTHQIPDDGIQEDAVLLQLISPSPVLSTQRTTTNARPYSIHSQKICRRTWQRVALFSLVLYNTFAYAHRPKVFANLHQYSISNKSDSLARTSLASYRPPIALIAGGIVVSKREIKQNQYAVEIHSDRNVDYFMYKIREAYRAKDEMYEESARKSFLEGDSSNNEIHKLLSKTAAPPLLKIFVNAALSISCQYDFSKSLETAQVMSGQVLNRGHDIFWLKCGAVNTGPEISIFLEMLQIVEPGGIIQTESDSGSIFYTTKTKKEFIDLEVNTNVNPNGVPTYPLQDMYDQKLQTNKFVIPNTNGAEMDLFYLSDGPSIGCIDRWGGELVTRSVVDYMHNNVHGKCLNALPQAIEFLPKFHASETDYLRTSTKTKMEFVFKDVLLYKLDGDLDYTVASEAYTWKGTPICSWDHTTRKEVPIMDAVNLNHDVAKVPSQYTIDELKKIPAFKAQDVLGCISKAIKSIAMHAVVNGNVVEVQGMPGHQELIQLSQDNEVIQEILDT